MGALNSLLLNKLSRDYGLKAPMDKVALVFFFIIASFVPRLIGSLLFNSFIKKEAPKRFDESTYTHNKPDSSAGDMSQILKQVQDIQSSVTKL